MNKGVAVLLCSASLLLFSGQTPAPSAPPLPSVPLRHLEYDFGVSYLATGEGHASSVGPYAGMSGSGIVSYDETNGRQGHLDVDILAVANDGGLVVRAQEQVQHREHQFPPVTCAVYGDGRVMCGNDRQNVPTDVMTALLSRLGRGFYDPTIINDKGSWQRSMDLKDMQVVANFTSSPHVDGQPLNIREHREIKSLTGAKDDYTEDTQIAYDITMSVPDKVTEDAVSASRAAAYLRSKIELSLVKDSFSKH